MESRRKVFEHGHGIVEYVLLTALVAMATLTIFRIFRQDLQEAYRKAGAALVEGVDASLSPDAAPVD